MNIFSARFWAMGLHWGVIFGWHGSNHFEPAEYGVGSGESAIEVALIAAPPEEQESDEPVEAQEVISVPEQVEAQETRTDTVEQPQPEPTASSAEPPVFDTVPETPKAKRTPPADPEPARRPATASKPKAVGEHQERSRVGLPAGRSGTDPIASRPTPASQASKPAYLHNPHPPYPEAARKAGQTGVVVLRVSINERGRVSGVSLAKSSGHSLLDDRARTAVQRWIFRPARQNGKSVATQVDVPVRFSLDR
jgi:periplasmic protein TonB